MVRGAAGVIGGLVMWTLVASISNLALRLTWPDYAQVEKAMTFTLPMMAARLVVGAISSLFAGGVVAWIAKRDKRAVNVMVIALLLMFVPLHYELWDRFPLWYHVVFLASLVVMTLLGAVLYSRIASPPIAKGDSH
jgi:hypothetical protein